MVLPVVVVVVLLLPAVVVALLLLPVVVVALPRQSVLKPLGRLSKKNGRPRFEEPCCWSGWSGCGGCGDDDGHDGHEC